MPKKPYKKEHLLWRRNRHKLWHRKTNPMLKGRTVSVEEKNKPVLDRIAAKIGVK